MSFFNRNRGSRRIRGNKDKKLGVGKDTRPKVPIHFDAYSQELR